MSSHWYYSKSGQRHGPVTEEELKRLATAGQLQASDLLWKEGMGQWTEAKKVKGLFPAQGTGNPQSPSPALPTAAPVIPPIPAGVTPAAVPVRKRHPVILFVSVSIVVILALLGGWAYTIAKNSRKQPTGQSEKVDTKGAKETVESGDSAVQKGYDKAIADCNDAIRLNPKDAKAYRNRGDAYEDKGDFDKAIADLTEAIRLDPEDAKAYSYRGFAYSKKDEHDKAIADFTEAIRLDPKLAPAYRNRGSAYDDKGEYDTAITDYNEAIRLDPKKAEAYRGRGVAYLKKGDLAKAIANYTEAIRLDPKNAISYCCRGLTYVNTGETDKEIADLTEAIRLDPRLALAYLWRGNAYLKKGDYDKAIADLTESIRLKPKDGGTYCNRGNAYHRKGDNDKAIADYDAAIGLNPKYVEAYYNRGVVYQQKGDNDKAIADYDTAIGLNPKYVEAYYNRGLAYGRKGDNDKAIADYTEAIRLNPKDAGTYYNRGNAYKKKGENDKAIADYNEANRLDPKLAQANSNRGERGTPEVGTADNYFVEPTQRPTIVVHDESIRLELKGQLEPNDIFFNTAAFVPSTGVLVTVGSPRWEDSGILRVTDPVTGRMLTRIKTGTRAISAIAVSPNGSLVALGSVRKHGTIKLWNVSRLLESKCRDEVCPEAEVGEVVVSNKDYLGPARADFAVLDASLSIRFSSDGHFLYAGGGPDSAPPIIGYIKCWKMPTLEEVFSRDVPERLYGIAIPPRQNVLVAGSAVRGAGFWNARTGGPIEHAASPEKGLFRLAVSADGSTLAFAGPQHAIGLRIPQQECPVAVWAGNDLTIMRRFVSPVPIWHMALSHNGRWLAASGRTSTTIWDAGLGKQVAQISGLYDQPFVAFSPHDKLLAVSCIGERDEVFIFSMGPKK